MIQAKQRIVYFAPLAGRHYQSLTAACHANARARIRSKYPNEEDRETGYWYSFEQSEPERYERLLKRLKRIFRQQFHANSAGKLL